MRIVTTTLKWLFLLLLFSPVHAQAQGTPRPVVRDTIIDGEYLKIDTSSRGIYHKTEKPPRFNGSFMAFLEQNLNYPMKAIDENVQGVVVIEFTVYRDGTLGDFKVAGDSPVKNVWLVEECIRIMRLSSGKWRPAIQNGYLVTCVHQQSINFVLQNKRN